MVRDSKMGNFAATCKNFGFSDIGDLLMMACHHDGMPWQF